LQTPDLDEIQLNYSKTGAKKLTILVPGLESNAEQGYVRRMAHYLNKAGFDVLVPDHRGCGDSTNKVFRSYHSGNSEDLDLVINSIKASYSEIRLIGFSLGGSIVMNYLADYPKNPVTSAVTISAPLDLNASSKKLEQPAAKLYNDRFVKKLATRLAVKVPLSDGQLYKSDLNACITLRDIDNIYTGPAHGYKNAHDYYTACSSSTKLKKVQTSTLFIYAKNDPLIATSEGLFSELRAHDHIELLLTEHGGHVAHASNWLQNQNWYERKTLEWLMRQP
jgi:predicted alpha/beta-fold hydrolase